MKVMMAHLLLIVCLLSLSQPQTPVADVPSLDAAMSQPAEEGLSGATDASVQIADASKLIVGENTVEARRIGVRTLLRIGTPEAMERLNAILTDSTQGNGAARSVVCSVLAASESPPDVLLTPLVNLVGDVKGPVLDGVQAALAAYPLAKSQKALCDLARDPTQPVARRLAVIEMVGRLGEDYAAAGVLAELLSDSDAGIRSASLASFARMTGVDFEDGDVARAWWRERAGLGELKWLVRSNQRRREELRALRAQRDTLVSRLVAAYRSSFLSLSEKAQGEQLVVFLKDDVSDVRKLGLDLIAAMVIDQKDVPAEVRAAIMPLLTDPVPGIREQSAVIAGNLRIAGAIDVMIESLKSEPNARVRAGVAGAIGRLDDTRAIEPLVGCLSSKDRALIAESVSSLGSLARRGHADEPTTERVTTAMEARYAALADDDVELREKFLRAMARIGAESLRSLFEHETGAGRSAVTRTAAIAGLSSYDNGGIAEFLAGLLADPDALVRGAAAQGLGRCGRTISHFEALFDRTAADNEADASVRDRAWEASQAMFGKLSASARLEVVAGLAENEDGAIQRRRAVLARALKGDRQAMAELSATNRVLLSVNLGESLYLSGDAAAALAEWQDASQYRSEMPPEMARRFDTGLLRSAMHIGDNATVVNAIKSAVGATGEAERGECLQALRSCLEGTIPIRVSAAQSGEAIALLYALIDPAVDALESGDEAAALKRDWASRIDARRDALIDALLDDQTKESTVAEHLQGFDRKVVISRIHARLVSMKQTTTGPASDREAALIALARQIVPEWPGYAPGISVEERDRALEQLIAG
ncbi:MAG: HEAT repeat domain-containing protein [Phycisphaerales bacterium]|nr:HEAT repeat domain-containing protein [Phycisphaerales bacterium]